MADASKFFPSSWLKAEDLEGRTVKVRTIPGDPIVEDKDIEKPVLKFVGFEKGLVLNKTNTDRLREMFGDQTDAWGDKEIELYIVQVPYKGEEVDAIRIRKPENKPTDPFQTEAKPEPPKPEEQKPSEEPKKEEPSGSSTSLINDAMEKAEKEAFNAFGP